MNKITFTEENIKKIINLYTKDQISLRSIGNMFKCSKHTIKKLLKSNSIAIRGSGDTQEIKFSEKEKNDILNQHNSKVPVYKIADQYDCADSTIRNFLKQWGIIFISKRPNPIISLEEIKSKKYGTLSVIEEYFLIGKSRRVLCQCDCGNQKIICLNSLRSGETITCGDHTKHNKTGKNCKTFTGYETITGSIVNRFRKGAKVRNIEFTVTAKYLYELFMSQNECCALSGIKLTLPINSKNCNKGTASIDRIDSSKGYIEGNVQWVFKLINFMKYTLSQEEFLEYCKIITNYQSEKPLPSVLDSSLKKDHDSTKAS